MPRDTPIEFISHVGSRTSWSKTGAIDRPFYELCALSTLRDRLRAGDVWVAGSRQYRAFNEYLLPQPDWQELRESGPVPVAIETTCSAYLEQRRDEVDQAMTKVAGLLANDQLPDVRLRNGRLTITPLRTTVPPEAEELGRRAYELLRCVRITDLLVRSRRDDWHESALYALADGRAGHRSACAVHGTARRGDQPGPGQDGPGLPRIHVPPACLDRRLVCARRDMPSGAGPSSTLSVGIRSPRTGATALRRPPTLNSSRWVGEVRRLARSTPTMDPSLV